jgi:nitroreductase
MDNALLSRIVASANLAPSVHNTQPARWHLASDGSVLVMAELARRLSAGDPCCRDMGVSCGAAVEGTVMALADAGIGVAAVEDLWAVNDTVAFPGYRLAARIVPSGAAQPSPLSGHVANRFTWRSHFKPAAMDAAKALQAWAREAEDVTLAHTPEDIAMLAALADDAGMVFLRDRAFRRELFGWMRLARSHPRYDADGLNLDALRMSALEGFGAGVVLGTGLFEAIDALGLGKVLTGEKSKTQSAAAIALFHRPRKESPVESGRAFYRFWLNLTRLGLAAWPMAAVADHAQSAEICSRHFAIPAERRLINVLRAGVAGAVLSRARLPVQGIIV